MKTKLIGLLAIIIAVGASAFTTPAKAKHFANLKWFHITTAVAVGSAPPAASATYMNTGTAPSSDQGCPQTAPDQCVSGFNANQVNSSNQLINNSQLPQEQPYQQNP